MPLKNKNKKVVDFLGSHAHIYVFNYRYFPIMDFYIFSFCISKEQKQQINVANNNLSRFFPYFYSTLQKLYNFSSLTTDDYQYFQVVPN